ncbi:MAG: ABC transporter ATP-binding protein [Defluviitaleaceae bacterium]|nr:ABC transporter ATP-binding protein [Defluviitaleaceae bacterium]
MILIEGVSKKYGKFLANDNVSLAVEAGKMTVLLGPNGAGKSTLIKSICGLLRYSGRITIGGHNNQTADAKRLLGYVPEMPSLYPMLTVYEHLEFIAKAYRLEDWEDYAEELLARFEMDENRNKLGRELSKGMQQKVSVSCALLPRPAAVILDEPLVGLDPHGIREIKNVQTRLKAEGVAVMVCTHLIDSIEEDWDTTCIMLGGKIAKICHRGEMPAGRTLEDEYFAIAGGVAE